MGRAVVLLAAFAALLFVWFGVSPPGSPSPSSGQSASPRQEAPYSSEYPAELTPETLRCLEIWLRRARDEGTEDSPTQDIFQPRSEPFAGPTPPPAEPAPPVVGGAVRLVGFVFPGRRRAGEAVAAVRFEGKMWLVGAGERLGPYVVREVVAGESVTLLDELDGDSLLLVLN